MPVSKCELEVKKELQRTEERIAETAKEIDDLQNNLASLSFQRFTLSVILQKSRPTSKKE